MCTELKVAGDDAAAAAAAAAAHNNSNKHHHDANSHARRLEPARKTTDISLPPRLRAIDNYRLQAAADAAIDGACYVMNAEGGELWSYPSGT